VLRERRSWKRTLLLSAGGEIGVLIVMIFDWPQTAYDWRPFLFVGGGLALGSLVSLIPRRPKR
jgi:hypothetical protein